MRVLVFGMVNCAGCTTVKNVLNQRGVEFAERDVMNVEHMAEAQIHGVRAVPTTVITGEDGLSHVFTGSTKATIDSILLHVGA